MTFVIEKGIALPAAKGGPLGKGKNKYPWKEMEVGDSFYTPAPEGRTLAKYRPTISGCASLAAKRLGMKFATRRDGDGLRVWRVA